MEIPIPMHTYSINRMSDHTRNMSVSVEFLMWLWRRVHIPSYLLSGASPSAAFREPRLAFPGTQAYPVIWFDFPEPMTFGSTQGTDFFCVRSSHRDWCSVLLYASVKVCLMGGTHSRDSRQWSLTNRRSCVSSTQPSHLRPRSLDGYHVAYALAQPGFCLRGALFSQKSWRPFL